MIDPRVEFDKTKKIEDIDGLWWVKGDTGAWEGPHTDWIQHKAMIEKHLPEKRNVVVQAGGNLGMYPKLLSRMFPLVYTFEPDPLNFHVLNLNCPEEHIIKTQAALGAKSDMIAVQRISMENVGMHMVAHEKTGAIPLVILDSYAWRHKIDLIFLDIEGYEINALYGAAQTIDRHRPVVIIERPSPAIENFFLSQNYSRRETWLTEALYSSN